MVCLLASVPIRGESQPPTLTYFFYKLDFLKILELRPLNIL